MWSIWVSSASERSPMPPEQPSTRRRTRPVLLLVESDNAVPAFGRRCAAKTGDPVRVKRVQRATRKHSLQVDEIDVDLVPLLRTIGAQRLAPEPEFLVRLRVHVRLQPDRLVDCDRFV